MTVDLIWERDCPNVEAARAVIREALCEVRLPESWAEWEIGQDTLPAYARGFGSPTILVNKKEIMGHPGGDSDDCCRVYLTPKGCSGVPTVEMIVTCLKEGISRLANP